MNRHIGSTLFELVIAISIIAIFACALIPAFSELHMKIGMNSSVNELFHTLHRARQNARITGTPTVVCNSADGKQCSANLDWADGWLMFANGDQDDPPEVDAGEPVLQIARAAAGINLRANRSAFTMRPFGQRSTNGTLTWCDRRGPAKARAVVVSYTGKPRISTTRADGKSLSCPQGDR